MFLGVAWTVLEVAVQQNLVLNPFFLLFRVLTTAPRAAPGRSGLRLRDAMGSTGSGGGGGDEADEGWPDKSWVKGDYEPGPSKKKKKKKGKGHRNKDEKETADSVGAFQESQKGGANTRRSAC